jgi:ABC-type bacteriocin/lantibiotic exporter with double-glycine peptidase domain
MMEFYRMIWLATWRQQLLLIILSVSVAALAVVPLKLQQLAINELVYDKTYEELLLLCAAYFVVVMISVGLKFLRSYRISVLGEGTVRVIRERLYGRHVADIAEAQDDIPEKGTLLSMISTDAEQVGKFAGSAIADPLLMIGILVSVTGFIATAQPMLGIVALGIILPQAVIVLSVQKFINKGVKKRVQVLRRASDSISASDLKTVERGILDDFDEIFETRRKIYRIKLSSKFSLKAINSAGTVGILLLGGWLVIQGQTDVGTVVAALTGLTQISGPWIELVAFFRHASTMRVRFDLITDRVFPRGGAREQSGSVRV